MIKENRYWEYIECYSLRSVAIADIERFCQVVKQMLLFIHFVLKNRI